MPPFTFSPMTSRFDELAWSVPAEALARIWRPNSEKVRIVTRRFQVGLSVA